jgi:hypothetical protein
VTGEVRLERKRLAKGLQQSPVVAHGAPAGLKIRSNLRSWW